jgi:hypothetical protein
MTTHGRSGMVRPGQRIGGPVHHRGEHENES